MQIANFKKAIDEWLESEYPDFEKGCNLFLQTNPRKRILYDNIVRRKHMEKLKRELRLTSERLELKSKNEDYRELTDIQIKEFSAKVEEHKQQTLPRIMDGTGKRGDHELLPLEAQNAYDENIDLYAQVRSLHEKLKLMAGDLDCDRYPFLKELVNKSDRIRNNWDIYDAAVPVNTDSSISLNPTASVMDANRVTANRKYLSSNKQKLRELKNLNPEKYEKVLIEMQLRYDEMVLHNQTFSEEQVKELSELGLVIKD